MIKIRLARLGAKRIRSTASSSLIPAMSNNGRPVATLGMYDPSKDMDTRLTVDAEAAVAWLGKGAQPTDTIRSIFKKAGIMAQFEASKSK